MSIFEMIDRKKNELKEVEEFLSIADLEKRKKFLLKYKDSPEIILTKKENIEKEINDIEESIRILKEESKNHVSE